MTVSEMSNRVGQTVLVSFEAVEVECSIVDAKASYGRIRFLVSPTAGMGSQWIEDRRIRWFVAPRTPLPQRVLDRLRNDEEDILRARGDK